MQIIARKLLLWGSLALPLITGTIAMLGQYKDPWSGFVKSPQETFINYAIPFPVAAGCIQLVYWPLTIGAVVALSYLKTTKMFLLSSSFILCAWVAFYCFDSKGVFLLYAGSNWTLISIALMISVMVDHRQFAEQDAAPNP